MTHHIPTPSQDLCASAYCAARSSPCVSSCTALDICETSDVTTCPSELRRLPLLHSGKLSSYCCQSLELRPPAAACVPPYAQWAHLVLPLI